MNSKHKNIKKIPSRHIIIKLFKNCGKEKILRLSHITCRGTKIRMTADFSWETKQARRHLSTIFKVLKEKKSVNIEFHTKKKIFQKQSQNKNLFSAYRNHQHTSTTRNVEGHTLCGRKWYQMNICIYTKEGSGKWVISQWWRSKFVKKMLQS